MEYTDAVINWLFSNGCKLLDERGSEILMGREEWRPLNFGSLTAPSFTFTKTAAFNY